jgi:hypothetical protein
MKSNLLSKSKKRSKKYPVKILDEFIAQYNGKEKSKIAFDWNKKFAGEFKDVNQKFREAITTRVLEVKSTNILLIRDLFLEHANWSAKAWCAPFTIERLGEQLIILGGTKYLIDFLKGALATFDMWCSNLGVEIPLDMIVICLTRLKKDLQKETSEKKKNLLKGGIDFFSKLRDGNAQAGIMTVKPGTKLKNLKVIGIKKKKK